MGEHSRLTGLIQREHTPIMGLREKIRNGLIGATLRFGVEEGTNQILKTRHRQGPNNDGINAASTQDAREDLGIGLPRGETPLDELLEDRDMKKVLGVSMEELRALSGIKDPFGECKFDPSEMPDFGGLDEFQAMRQGGPGTAKDRQALVEKIQHSRVPAPVQRPRRYGINPDSAALGDDGYDTD